MLNQDEAQQLMIDLITLRKQAKEQKTFASEAAFKKQEELCIKKFEYIVYMNTNKYKAFSNYEDLVQEGLEALVKSMKNYDPKKGSFFWWSNRYVQTKIARSANLYTTIRFPLKHAKQIAPRKEYKLPLLIENIHRPDDEYEKSQITDLVQHIINQLDDEQKEIITMAYGLDGNKPMSINKLCKQLCLTRTKCINKIEEAIVILKQNIRL